MTLKLGAGTGPLRGLKVIEIAGIGPGPHACMILADLGADVIRIERPGGGPSSASGSTMIINRGRPSVALDLRRPEAVKVALELVRGADLLVEGMRPGVTERLGLGPDECLAVNPRLIYGRVTGWGQDGPLAAAAGHDINYISITGALFGLGQTPERPQFPINLVGDYGGGSTYLVIGLLAALLEARVSGRGQVVDAAIVDGAAHLNSVTSALAAGGEYREKRGVNVLDGGVPYYDIYETSDGQHVSVGSLEPQFYGLLIKMLELDERAPEQDDIAHHGELRALLAETFRSRSQNEWIALFEGTDACVAGVIPLSRAVEHPHLRERGTFVEREGIVQPQPAPRFSRTRATLGLPPSPSPGAHTREALAAWGITNVDTLLDEGVAFQT